MMGSNFSIKLGGQRGNTEKVAFHQILKGSKGVIKKKIQPSKFEALIGCIKRFMNWTASHIARRKALRGAVQNKKGFVGRRVRQGSY